MSTLATQSVVQGPAASVPLGSLLEIQHLCSFPIDDKSLSIYHLSIYISISLSICILFLGCAGFVFAASSLSPLVESRGYSPVAMRRPLIAVVSLVAEHRL